MPSSLCRPLHRRCRPEVESLEDRIVPSHTPITNEFEVPQNGSESFFFTPEVAVAADFDGDSVTVWTDVDEGGIIVKARLYDEMGNPQSNDIIVASNLQGVIVGEGRSLTIDVAMTDSGSFVVVYDVGVETSSNPGAEVHAEFFDASGTFLSETTVAPRNGASFDRAFQPQVALDGSGNALVSFIAQSGSGARSVAVQRLTPTGGFLGDLITVSDASSVPLTRPSIGADSAGNFVVGWNADVDAGAPIDSRIVFQRFSSSGAPQGGIVQLEGGDANRVVSTGKASLTGDFVLAWQVIASGSTSVRAQSFFADGTARGPSFQVNTTPQSFIAEADVSVAALGDYVVGWTTGTFFSVKARVFNADGSPETVELSVNQASFDLGPTDIAISRDFSHFISTWAAFDESESPPTPYDRIYGGETRLPPIDPPAPPATPPVTPPDDTPAMLIALLNSMAMPSPNRVDPFVFEPGPTPPPSLFVPRSNELAFTPPFLLLSGSQPPLPMLGSITGQVFLDLNGNGRQDDGEMDISGQRVFLDLNNNGQWDEGEPFCLTDAMGRYAFSGLSLDRYRVRQDLRRPRIAQTLPQRNEAYLVELTRTESAAFNLDFGTKVLSVPEPAGSSEATPINNSTLSPGSPDR